MKRSLHSEWPIILSFGVIGQALVVIQFFSFAPLLLLPLITCFIHVFMSVERVVRDYHKHPRTD